MHILNLDFRFSRIYISEVKLVFYWCTTAITRLCSTIAYTPCATMSFVFTFFNFFPSGLTQNRCLPFLPSAPIVRNNPMDALYACASVMRLVDAAARAFVGADKQIDKQTDWEHFQMPLDTIWWRLLLGTLCCTSFHSLTDSLSLSLAARLSLSLSPQS